MGAPSLDGRRFGAAVNPDGDVGAETVFAYAETSDGVVSATYAGGAVRSGWLIGTREGDRLDFRYVHLTTGGETASGHCVSEIRVLDDGRLRLEETWAWESRAGSGTSVVDELPS